MWKITSSLKQTSNTEEFIQKAKNIHQNKYLYDEVNYGGSYSKVKIICPKHGVWKTAAINHLSGNGCPDCAKEKTNYQRYKNKKQLYITYIFLNTTFIK